MPVLLDDGTWALFSLGAAESEYMEIGSWWCYEDKNP